MVTYEGLKTCDVVQRMRVNPDNLYGKSIDTGRLKNRARKSIAAQTHGRFKRMQSEGILLKNSSFIIAMGRISVNR